MKIQSGICEDAQGIAAVKQGNAPARPGAGAIKKATTKDRFNGSFPETALGIYSGFLAVSLAANTASRVISSVNVT
jgi:hypothetical protein